MNSFFSCRTSTASKFGHYFALYFCPLLSIALIFAAVLICIDVDVEKSQIIGQLIIQLLIAACAVFLAFFLLKISRRCYRMETRQISIDQFGLTIRDKNERLVAWTNVESIGVIAYASNASKQYYQTQICIFLKPVISKDLKKLRDSYLFGAFNLDSFILLDFDSQVIEKLERHSAFPVHDYISEQMKL